MSTILETTIDGFTVTIEPNDDRPGVNCWIAKGRASSSLAKAQDFGAIGDNEEVPISTATLDRIQALADRHGYSD